MFGFDEIEKLVELEVEYLVSGKICVKIYGPFEMHRDAMNFITRDERDHRGLPNRDAVWGIKCKARTAIGGIKRISSTRKRTYEDTSCTRDQTSED